MSTAQILQQLDAEIARLQKARAVLDGQETHRLGSSSKSKRSMSAAARARIGAAQKARWAKLKAHNKKKR